MSFSSMVQLVWSIGSTLSSKQQAPVAAVVGDDLARALDVPPTNEVLSFFFLFFSSLLTRKPEF